MLPAPAKTSPAQARKNDDWLAAVMCRGPPAAPDVCHASGWTKLEA